MSGAGVGGVGGDSRAWLPGSRHLSESLFPLLSDEWNWVSFPGLDRVIGKKHPRHRDTMSVL